MNTENNKIIAEFMGLELEETLSEKFVYARYEQNNPKKEIDVQTNFYEESELLYHFDWNWLMEVVEKIESLENVIIGLKIEGNNVTITGNFKYGITAPTKIESVYNACVEFIEWYNEQPKT